MRRGAWATAVLLVAAGGAAPVNAQPLAPTGPPPATVSATTPVPRPPASSPPPPVLGAPVAVRGEPVHDPRLRRVHDTEPQVGCGVSGPGDVVVPVPLDVRVVYPAHLDVQVAHF